MTTHPLGFRWILGGRATELDPAQRLTSFRDALFREGALRDLSVDGYRYCVAERGEGPPLVLVHGLGGSLYDWRHLFRPLSEHHRVIAIDLLGSGESDLPEDEDYSIAAQARRLRGILETFGVDRATLVGNSYGGGIVLRFAQDWPGRVDRLVLLNSVCYAEHIPGYVTLARLPFAGSVAEAVPIGKIPRWALGHAKYVMEILDEAEIETYNQELRRPGRLRASVDVLRSIVPLNTTEFVSRLRDVEAPTLLIWGARDKTVPVELGRKLALELPNARLHELDAGHVPNQERPDDVLRLMRDFLPKPAPSE